MSNHSNFLSQKRFGSLDGLRALSIIAVIWHHTASDWFVASIAHIGYHGVTLFFAISGFLITTLLLRERSRNGTVDLKAFYFRRTLRIFPLYYGVLLLYIAIATLLEKNTIAGQAFFGNLKYFATFTSNIFVPLDGRVIFYFAWSVAAEEQFYLLWPSLILMTKTVGKNSIFLCVVLTFCVLGQLIGNKFLSAIPLAIVLGALLATILHTEKGYCALEVLIGQPWSFATIASGLALALSIENVPNFVIHILFAAIVGSCVINENHPIKSILTWKPISYIGTISYGMYMLHMLCKNITLKFLGMLNLDSNGLEVFALTFLFATILAGLSFKYYESAFIKIKQKYER